MLRIGVVGCAGRMGRAVIAEVLTAPGLTLAGGIDRPEQGPAADLGTLAGTEPLGVTAGSDVDALLAVSDVLIEFSSPAATLANAARVAAAGRAHVVGTTGLDPEQERDLAACAQHAAILWSANMSLGVTLMTALVERMARSLDDGFDIEIVEMHHRHKVDAPSGTALALGRAAAQGRNVALNDAAVRGRDGLVGARRTGEIGFSALRGGDVVGDHRVVFAGLGERLELAHIATDRRIYARGAVRAARWLQGRSPGLYTMADVLGSS